MSRAIRQLPRLSGRLARPVSTSTSPAWLSSSTGPRCTRDAARRAFSTSQFLLRDEFDERARRLNQKGLDEQEQEVRVKQNQIKRPWLRQDADKPPAEQDPASSPPPQGKLLTTPTRLLKLIVPLPIRVEKDKNNNSRDYARAISTNDQIQPLALLVHPQQPLSYVERLIQAELPPVIEDGTEKIPNIYFRAEDSAASDNSPAAARSDAPTSKDAAAASSKHHDQQQAQTSAQSNPHVASYSGLGHEAKGADAKAESDKKWVRWSSSTEMGDFIRDAARGREFAIEVEGYDLEMRVSVPSFNDRTYYLRMRLRRMSKQIDQLAQIKQECDELAHKSAHRLAQGGFALLAGWWGVVYYVTFQTEWGWDLVEPVTYLVGLTTIMGGYLWFLYISRDLSYKAAMNVTVSRRQNALYESKGFDMQRWDQLVQEANSLRREIKTIAAEYDVDWDEMKDLSYSQQVKKALEKDRHKRNAAEHEEDEDDEANAVEEERKVKEEMARDSGGSVKKE